MAFSFQFELYPSGDPSLYKTMVNSPSGVSAIRDNLMGISEYSVSGIAFYINKIENNFNIHNIGISGDPVVSGYFSKLGYIHPDPQVDDWPYSETSNGLVSGVQNIWSSGVTLNTGPRGGTTFIKNLIPTSGTFYNVIFDKKCFDDNNNEYFTTLTLDSNGTISDSYNGFFHDISEDIYKKNTTRLLSNSGIIVDGILVKGKYGVVDGSLITSNITHSGDITISGNLTLNHGSVGLDSITSVGETIFSFDSHSHSGGIDGKEVSAASFNSNEDPDDYYSVTLVSGNIEVGQTLTTPSIGLYGAWEPVGIYNGLNTYQGLKVIGEKLYAHDRNKIAEIKTDGSLAIKSVNLRNKKATIDGISTVSIQTINHGMDSISAFSHWPNVTDTLGSGFINSVLTTNVIDNLDVSKFDGSSREADYGTKIYGMKRKDHTQNFHRVYGNTYYTTYDQWSNTGGWAFTLWNFNEYNKVVGVVEVDAFDNDMLFMKGFELDGTLVFPYRIQPSGEYGCITHNPIYQFYSDDGIRRPNLYGSLQWFSPSGNALSGSYSVVTDSNNDIVYDSSDNYLTTSPPDASGRNITDFAYFDNAVYYLSSDSIFRCSMSTRNEPTFYYTGMFGVSSIVAYAGRLWTGKALEMSYTKDGVRKVDERIKDSLRIITRANSDPWIASPVVYDGWLYALAATNVGYNTWLNQSFDDKYAVEYILPPTIIVRRRADESSLTKLIDVYTK